jgi:N-acetylneuraminate synthase/N,N'-diacetyllegionaminate synthase
MFSIDGTPVGRGHRPYIVAEAGVNYLGDIELAKAFIEEAADADADAIKFQTHIQSSEMSRSAMTEQGYGDLYDRMAEFELTIEQHRKLQEHCAQHGISFLSTPFSAEAVKLLDSIDIPAIKIGSGEFSNSHLIKTAADTRRPLVISTGMSSWDDIETQVPFIETHADEFALLYCVSAYPTQPEEFNLGVIDRMYESFGVPIGFSDHSKGIGAAVTAIGFGASLIEKHFTIDRRLPGGDQEVSIEPEKLDELTDYADLAVAASGRDRALLEAEQEIKQWAVHSVVTTERVEAGERLTESNTTTKRPGTGIPANEYYETMGRRVDRTIEPDTVVREDDLRPE